MVTESLTQHTHPKARHIGPLSSAKLNDKNCFLLFQGSCYDKDNNNY